MDSGISITGRIEQFSWSTQEAVGYEAAIEAANHLIGAYTARIAQQQAQKQPDQSLISELQQARTSVVHSRDTLVAQDSDQVATQRAIFNVQLAELERRAE
ncbi:hypothetical protein [Nonomuraea jabiensis]|uniref:hypothetical protein n=1 Tax=Nonomuraea jabiensis TaxID=882448 RepID=UPI003D717B1C